jgi:hypothetical protein
MLKSTRKFYETAVHIFLGNQVIRRLALIQGAATLESIQKVLSPGKGALPGKWLDLAGMFASEQSVQQLFDKIKSGSIKSLEEIASGLEQIHAAYEQEVWNWTVRILAERFNLDVGQINTDQLLELINKWESESIKLDKMILSDAGKEFDNSSKIGFGIDGDEEIRNRDFDAVRGVLEENKFIVGIGEEMKKIELKAAELRKLIQG